jgi:lipoprotein NlpD
MIFSRFFLASILFALYACSTSMHVPVEDIGQANNNKQLKTGASTYTVEKGDTLFSIALRYDLDYKKLAQANNIYPPYIIRPNDVIYLREPKLSSGIVSSEGVTVYPVKNPIVAESVKNTGNLSQKGVKQKHTETLQVVKKKQVAASGKEQNVVASIQKVEGSIPTGEGWIWPVTGKVVREFSPQDTFSKGIHISASMDTPVVSSRSGEVVYAGSGLKGYGNLIIIRHDDTYISAYAHNKTIAVKEGQIVQRGQKIGEVGMSGTQFPKLHFEIREHGKPINPLKMLPVKK